MPLWGLADQADNIPKYATAQVHKTSNSVNMANLYANTTVGGFFPGAIAGVFAANTSQTGNITSAGWLLEITGTGPVVDLGITAGGKNYSNTDVVTVSGGGVNATATIMTNPLSSVNGYTLNAGGTGYSNTDQVNVTGGTANATATLTTNSTGGITAVTPFSAGAGFNNNGNNAIVVIVKNTGAPTSGSAANIVPIMLVGVISGFSGLVGGSGFVKDADVTVALANSSGGAATGTGATVTAVLGGRANRKTYETLVAASSIA